MPGLHSENSPVILFLLRYFRIPGEKRGLFFPVRDRELRRVREEEKEESRPWESPGDSGPGRDVQQTHSHLQLQL